jgi:hypothetical protein
MVDGVMCDRDANEALVRGRAVVRVVVEDVDVVGFEESRVVAMRDVLARLGDLELQVGLRAVISKSEG